MSLKNVSRPAFDPMAPWVWLTGAAAICLPVIAVAWQAHHAAPPTPDLDESGPTIYHTPVAPPAAVVDGPSPDVNSVTASGG